MTYQDERDELVASWLAEGPHHGRPSELNEALAGVRSVRQRPGWLVAMTGGTIAQRPVPLLRFAPLLAAVALVSVIAGAIVVGSLPPKPPPPIVNPSASPVASPAPVAVEQLPGEETRLEAGQRYTVGLAASGSDPVAGECADVEVRVDVAFTAGAHWLIGPPTTESACRWSLYSPQLAGGERGIAYHPVSSVFVDACDVDGRVRAVGPTVNELVSALDQQANTDMSDPVDVTVGGYPGKRFDVTVGGNVPESCNSDGGRQFVWLWPGMSMWVDRADSDTRTVYVIDVEGHRVVFGTSIRGHSPLHQQAIDEVMASMEFSVR